MTIRHSRFEKFLRDEAETRRLGIGVKYMSLSLSCRDHESLHGVLQSAEEIRSIFHPEVVSEDCKCAIVQVLVDDKGNPRTPRVVQKAREQLEKWRQRDRKNSQ
jgi:hypothetical protein